MGDGDVETAGTAGTASMVPDGGDGDAGGGGCDCTGAGAGVEGGVCKRVGG